MDFGHVFNFHIYLLFFNSIFGLYFDLTGHFFVMSSVVFACLFYILLSLYYNYSS